MIHGFCGLMNLQSDSQALPCSLKILSLRFTFKSPFFRMPITISYDKPGWACSAFVKAARSVWDATTSRLSSYKCSLFRNFIRFTIRWPEARRILSSQRRTTSKQKLPGLKLGVVTLAKLTSKLAYHLPLSFSIKIFNWM